MKFRFSVQPKPKEFKSIVPSHLLSDPAFSADPRSNPDSDTNKFGWDAPPLGHPLLKNKKKDPTPANFVLRNGIVASADFDLQPVQPPNSPVSCIGGSGTQYHTSFPFPPPTLNTAPSTDSPHPQPTAPTLPVTSLDPRSEGPSSSFINHPQLPAKEVQKKRMNFLSRRKTIQATSSNSSTVSSSIAKSSFLSSDNNIPRAVASRTASQSVISVPRDRPILPARAATSGTSTPRSTITTTSALSKRPADNRNNDLDRIDELDETSPLGLSLHHDGPYEVASQALKRGGDDVSLGTTQVTSSSYVHGMQAYGKPYFPPQAPIGVSLNLSPGQILPRNFGEPRANAPPRMRDNRDNAVRPPRMQQAYPSLHPSLSRSQSQSVSPTSSIPPRHLHRADTRTDNQSDVSRSRHQSQPPPSPFSPLPNPHPVIHTESRPKPRPQFAVQHLQSQISLDLAPPSHIHTSHYNSDTSSLYQSSLSSRNSHSSSSLSRRRSGNVSRSFIVSNPSSESSHRTSSSTRSRNIEPVSNLIEVPGQTVPFDIGMAMLRSQDEPEAPVIPTPRIYLPHGTPESEKEFNPYDPVHLQDGHSRTPSPLALAYDNVSHSSHEQPSHEPSREPSRQPSPARSLEVPPQLPARPMRAPERLIKPLLTVRNANDPPPYTFAPGDNINNISFADDKLDDLSRRSTHFRMAAEGESSFPNVNVNPERILWRQSNHLGPPHELQRPRSETFPPTMEPKSVQGVQVQVVEQVISIPVVPVDRRQQSSADLRSIPEPQTQFVRPPVNQGVANVSGDLQQVMPMLPARRSRERLVPPPPSTLSGYEPDRDARSTHLSFSTGSSGNPRSGPPPRRYVPKHLVMPTPLNTSNIENAHAPALNSYHSDQPSPPTYIPPRQIPPRRAQVNFNPQAQVYYPPPSSSPLALANNVHTPSNLKPPPEINTQASRKLKKRTSIMPPPPAAQIPPPPPKISTVSFAPPVVGYDQQVPFTKSMSISRPKTEKNPKRVLSKRRADL